MGEWGDLRRGVFLLICVYGIFSSVLQPTPKVSLQNVPWDIDFLHKKEIFDKNSVQYVDGNAIISHSR